MLVACMVGLSLLGGTVGAGAQVQGPPVTQAGTWVGEVVRHDGHFDYVGSPCPIEAEVCILSIARYLIVPTTAQAAQALPRVAGARATLAGRLLPLSAGAHQGILLVSGVAPAPPSPA